jgi:hypothetical protein
MSYFTFPTPLTRLTVARAETLNAIFQQIANSFGELPGQDYIREDRVSFGLAVGTSALVLPLPFGPATYVQGFKARFIAASANPGPATLEITVGGASRGVRNLLRGNGAALIANDIVAGQVVEAVYDGTAFRIAGFIGGDVAAAAASAATAQAAANAATPVIPHIAMLGEIEDNLGGLTAIAADLVDLTAVAAALGEIGVVAALNASIAALGPKAAEIEIVADNIADVNTAAGTVTAAGLAADIGTLADVSADIAALGPISAGLTALAGITADISTVADMSGDVATYAQVYHGGRATPLTLRPDGSALEAGDHYYNTDLNAVLYWNGSSWNAAAGSGVLQVANNLSDLANVAAAITNLGLGDVVRNTRSIVAGVGLTGGGTLAADRSISLNAATQASLVKADTAVQPSRLVATGSGLTGGGDLSANRTIAVDSTVARTTTAINTGSGLTGGGNLSASRTLAVDSTVLRTTGGQTVAGMTFSAGASFGSRTGASVTDLSQHIALWGTQYGLSITGNQFNIVAAAAASTRFYFGGVLGGRIEGSGFIGSGAGLTSLNASELDTGAVPAARLTSVPAASLTGTVNSARLPVDSGANSWVFARYANLVPNGVGTPATLIRTSAGVAVTWGQEIPASQLQRAGMYEAGEDADNIKGSGGAVSGTWMALCDAPADAGRYGGGLFVRVA